MGLAFFLAWPALVPAGSAAAPADPLADAAFFAQLNSIRAQVQTPRPIVRPPRTEALPGGSPPGLPPSVIEAVQRQDLLPVGNDNDSSHIEFSLGLDAAGRILALTFASPDGSGRRWDFPLDEALRSCSVRGSKRLSRDNACGVELFHAIFDTSAIRLLAPELSAETGGVVTLIYLRHYSLFGKSREAELNIRLRQDSGGWGLYLAGDDPGRDPAESSRRIEGLFIHRDSRGIAAVIPCLGGSCPASWERPYKKNKGLPPVYVAPGA